MKKNVLLATVALLLIGVAVYRFLGGKADDPPPSGGLEFVCGRCNLKFSVTYDQWDRLLQRRDFRVPPNTKTMLIKCPQCNDYTAQKYEEPEPPPPEGTPPPQ